MRVRKSDFKANKLRSDKKSTKKNAQEDDEVTQGVRVQHPNRNVNKPNATNAGGFKN